MSPQDPPLPVRLDNLRRRFEHWRATRTGSCRIPPALWRRAARYAARYGVYRTARALGLDYNSLKRRAGAGAPPPKIREATPRFVELLPPGVGSPAECVLEIENRQGSRLRVHLRGRAVPDMAALARSFCGEEA